MKELLGFIGITLSIIGYIPYINDTLKKKTTPHIFSWFIWGFLTLIAFGIHYTNNAGPASWVTFSTTVLTFFIALIALRNGDIKINKLDYLFLFLAIISTVLWLRDKSNPLATYFQLSAGIIALGPTITKSWHSPHEETLSTYLLNAVRHLVTLSAIERYSINTALHPIVWSIANFSVAFLLLIRRRRM